MQQNVSLSLLIWCVLTVPLLGLEFFNEVQQEGVKQTIYASNAFQVQYTNSMFYTINVSNPGYIEQGAYNKRSKTGYVKTEPFFRWRAGPVVRSDRKLDFYIDASSRGFFVVRLPHVLGYTRDGRFMVDSRNRLVTMSGQYPVMGESGFITIPDGKHDDLMVSRSGVLYHNGQPFDKFKITVFRSFQEMQSMDTLNGSFFVLTKPIPVMEGEQYYAVFQGYLNQNNVIKGLKGDGMMSEQGFNQAHMMAHKINKSLDSVSAILLDVR